MVNKNPARFIKKRRNKNARKLFHKVIKYFVFCYLKSIHDKVTYSLAYIEKDTKIKVEDFLKDRFVIDYLRKRENKLAYQEQLFVQSGMKIRDIENLLFFPETEVEYVQGSFLRNDKIDVLVTNLPLDDYWADVDNESIYFVFEFKRLKNTSKNPAYLTDTEKFVNRKYSQFRFPYNGMVGLVEKSSISINEIIEDLEEKLQKHSIIKSIPNKGKILKPFNLIGFEKCKISSHQHNSEARTIDVIHMFFDYSKIIVP